MRTAVAASEVPVHSARSQSVWQRQARKIRASKYLLLLVLPGFVWYVIFMYFPMYGVTIAFKELSLRLGILGSPWIGFDNFERFFNYPHFWRLIGNTFLLSFYTMLFGFPAPIIFALALNEVVNNSYKRTVQTISFLPHFIAMPAVVGMLFLILSPSTGFVNVILGAFGIEPIYFMIKPRWSRSIYVISDVWQNVGWGAIIYLGAALAGRSGTVRGGDGGRRLAAAQDVAHRPAGAGPGDLDPAHPAYRRAGVGRGREGDPDVQ